MYKQILLLFIIIFSTIGELSMFAQVIIKDEIILYETENPDEENLTMPFYGRVEGEIYSGNFVIDRIRKVVIEVNGQIMVVKSCPCTGCTWIADDWEINDVAAGLPITVRVYAFCQNGQYVEAETELINLGNHAYEIKAYNPNYAGWFWATTLEFKLINCTNAFNDYCDGNEFTIPDFEVEEVQPNVLYSSVNICSPPGRFAGTVPADGSQWLADFVVDACFDREKQRWQFMIDNEYNLFARVVIEICYQNIQNNLQMILVDSWEDVYSHNPNYSCTDLLEDIDRFYYYGDYKPNRYTFTDLIYEHELQHKQSYLEGYDALRDFFDLDYENTVNIYLCNDFINPADAQVKIKKEIEKWAIRYREMVIYNNKIFRKSKDKQWAPLFREYEELRLNRRIFSTITTWWVDALTQSQNCNP